MTNEPAAHEQGAGEGWIRPRTTEHVPILNATPYVAFVVPWSLRPPQRSLTLVVKATYALPVGGDMETGLTLADEQRPPMGDLPSDPEVEGASLRYASDFAPVKLRADVTLEGFGYLPGPDRTAGLVELEVGPVRQRLAIFGPRRWDPAGGQTEPEPCDRVPLVYERAFGGPRDEANPVGLGQDGQLLPQLEHPERLVRGPDDGPPPACFAPMSSTWKVRARHLGKDYGGAYLKERWPFYAADFDAAHFNAAPAALQTDFLRGDERVRVSGCHSEGPVAGRLPGRRPRLFAIGEDGTWREAEARLDTLHVDADSREVIVLWRGVFEVANHDATDLRAVAVVDEPLDAPLSLAAVREQIQHASEAQQEDAEPTEARPLPTVDSPPDRSVIEAAVQDGRSLRGVEWMGADLSGMLLSGCDLTGAMLVGCDLSDAIFDGAVLEDARLDGTTARGTSFKRANLARAELAGAVLEGASFEEATLTEAMLDGVQANQVSFRAVEADRASFTKAALVGANLEDADLSGANLSGADLSGAVLRRARLHDVRLYETRAEGADFDGAEGTDLRADDGAFAGARFVDSKLGGASFEGADLREARLSGAVLDGANFARVRGRGALLDGCSLRRASARGAELAEAVLRSADLMQADLTRATLERADLRDASLYQSDTWEAELDGALLEGADRAGTKLEGSR
ncbi:MAG: DUF2169 domain-containing protein [Polyangiaceae bacterium]